MSVFQSPTRYQPEEARQPQMRHYDHHAEQERERVEIDSAIGLVGRDRANRHHQRRAGERNAGAIQPEPGDAA
jgi:hypothetical protein